MSKEKFKEFIKTNPQLAKAVFDGKTTFQKLYETYDIYGESSDIFNQYLNNKAEPKVVNNTSFAEIANMFKNIDLDTVQKGVNGLQIKSDPNLYNYLRQNSYWYKYLNRNPVYLKQMEDEMKEKYKLRSVDKIENISHTIKMVESILDIIK